MSNFEKSIFELGEADGRAFYAHPVGELEGDDVWRFALGEAEPTGVITLRHAGGQKRPGDLLTGGFAALRIVSDAFVAALTAAECTGWATFPVCVEGVDPAGGSRFHGLAVRGRCGELSPTRPNRRGETGVLIAEESWDGSDLFCPHETTMVLLSSRAKDALDRAALRNVELTRLSDVRVEPTFW